MDTITHKAITTALTVVTVKAIMMILDKLSIDGISLTIKYRLSQESLMSLILALGVEFGVMKVKIAAVNNPTAAVLITVAKNV